MTRARRLSAKDRRFIEAARELGGLTVLGLCAHCQITFSEAAKTLFDADRRGLLVRSGGARGAAFVWHAPSLPLTDGGQP